MRPVVIRSVNDGTSQRCVDFLRHGDGSFGFRECRRDPEDAHGWRHLSGIDGARFVTLTDAEYAAAAAVCWFSAGGCA